MVRAVWSAAITSSNSCSARGELGRGGCERVETAVERVEIGRGTLAALEQLLQRLRVEAAAQLGDQVEPRLDRLLALRIGLQRGDEPVQVASDLAQPHGQLAELGRGAFELGGEPRQRLQCALRCCGERSGPVSVLGCDGRRRARGALGEIGRVAHALALGPERVLLACLQAVGALDEVAQRLDARSRRTRIARHLLVVPARGRK